MASDSIPRGDIIDMESFSLHGLTKRLRDRVNIISSQTMGNLSSGPIVLPTVERGSLKVQESLPVSDGIQTSNSKGSFLIRREVPIIEEMDIERTFLKFDYTQGVNDFMLLQQGSDSEPGVIPVFVTGMIKNPFRLEFEVSVYWKNSFLVGFGLFDIVDIEWQILRFN